MPANAVDFVGFGAAANAYEGTAPTKTLDAKTSAQRRPYANVDPATGKGNAWDTDDNASDFYVGPVAAPRNTASPPEADGSSYKLTGQKERTFNLHKTAMM